VKLGVCYYPEHWPQDRWAEDARRMVEMGLSWVRIAEFAWSRIEPEPGRFDWAWLDDAMETLAGAGLKIVMCTPTAAPPKWLIDAHPDILAWDAQGRPRGFGSRRHYCFSSDTYRAECARIVKAVAGRYGQHPAVGAWQTDNEYACHDTTHSYSPNAARRFRHWLAQRYQSPDALNRAWGSVFWSQEYRSFDEVELPNLAVTEANPSHRMDFARFASDEVASFNKLQTDILRGLSPGRDLTHNFMAFETNFDHFKVGEDLDFACWDSYPLGHTEAAWWLSGPEQAHFMRQGHPDIPGFQHDLYRAVGRGRWWVMEQQPGPVNWGRHNPSPLPGMVRAWTWQAFAHGAEVVTYFRWRQAPFAQEQMHSGLNRPDRSEDVGGAEARQVAEEIARLGDIGPRAKAKVAILFDYQAAWQLDAQPQGAGFSWIALASDFYRALRAKGLDVDFVPPDGDFSGYALVVCPSAPILSAGTVAALEHSGAAVLFGPRTGSRTADGWIPDGLPPGPLQARLPIKVVRVESLRAGAGPTVRYGGQDLPAKAWREFIETPLAPLATFVEGGPALVAQDRWYYLATWAEPALMDAVIAAVAKEAGLEILELKGGVRLSRRGGVTFAVNFARDPRKTPAPDGARFLIGGPMLDPAGVAAWR
jgi:beta-galactosidase